MALSTLILLYDHHHYPSPENFHLLKQLMLGNSPFSPPSTQPLAISFYFLPL